MERLTQQKEKFTEFIDQYVYPVLAERIDRQLIFIEKVSEFQKGFVEDALAESDRRQILGRSRKYKIDLAKLLGEHFENSFPGDFGTQFDKYQKHSKLHLSHLDMWIHVDQSEDRFKIVDGDNFLVRLIKAFKRFFYFFSKIPERIANLFRKNKKSLRPWKHRVAFRNLTHYYLQKEFSLKVLPLISEINETICATFAIPWQIDNAINTGLNDFMHEMVPFQIDQGLLDQLRPLPKGLKEAKIHLKEDLSQFFEEVYEQFVHDYGKVGTLELSNRRFHISRVFSKEREIKKKSQLSEQEWSNTREVLINDWLIDVEFYHVLLSALIKYNTVQNRYQSKFAEPVTEKLDAIRTFFDEIEKPIHTAKSDKELKAVFDKEKKSVQSTLVKELLPSTNTYILSQGLSTLIDKFEKSIDSIVGEIRQSHGLVEGVDFSNPKPIKTSSISNISPYELINFENRPPLMKMTQQLKIQLTNELSNLQLDILDLGRISEFNLETALASFGEQEESLHPRQIALEGISRTRERLQDLQDRLSNISKIIEVELFEALQNFNKKLIEFTNTDNILDIRVRIVKAKAIERSTAIREQVIDTIRNIIPLSIAFFKSHYQRANDSIRELYIRYGIIQQEENISTELSDFLLETQRSISQLPFVYRRLFNTQDLTDDSFFIGRTKELEALDLAYNIWQKGRFANTLITGEKGCGSTSFLNYFLKKIDSKFDIIRLQPTETIYTVEGLYAFFNKALRKRKKSLEEWGKYLDSGKKKIVILEDIQRLYLRKVNGFDAIKEVIRLISYCDTNTWWVLSCSQYAYDFLNKSLQLPEQFNHHIPLLPFDNNQIKDMIQQRHKVSGYNVRYGFAPIDEKNRKLRSLKDEDQQQLLEEEYFNSLNKIANSNIFLLLTYWVRSIEEIKDSTIFICSLKKYDLSFLDALQDTKIFALNTLAMHEKLSEEDFGQILQIGPIEARRTLYPMLDRGILIFEDPYYSINPLLYRQAISLLKNKNLIKK